MQISEDLIRSVVSQVIREVRGQGAALPASGDAGRFGIFDDANQAVAARASSF